MNAFIEAQNLSLAGGELFMVLGAMVLLMIGAFQGERSATMVNGLAVAIFIIAGIWVYYLTPDGVGMNGAFVMDPFARLMKLLVLIGGGLTLVMSINFIRREGYDRFEFAVLMLLSVVGMMLMISANSLITVYMGMELQSLALYVIAAFKRDSIRSAEAGLKYFVLGALSSAMLLYGISLVYGFTGHVDFPGVKEVIAGSGHSIGLIFGLVFVVAGIAFKISVVPFHMWTPDVYEGAPTPVTTFFATAPKIAAMALLIRVLVVPFAGVTPDWQQIITFLAIASMALGAFAAIGQTNIKRMLAYSSIGHMGFALVGLAAGTEAGVTGVIIYMVVYMSMSLGVFAVVLSMRRKEGMVEDIQDLAGLASKRPMMALFMTILMFSMAGIPPLGGFFAKYFVFLAAIEAKLYALAVIGMIASVISAFYYLRVIKVMWFDEAKEDFVAMPTEMRFVLGLSGLFVLFFFFVAGPVQNMSAIAATTFF